MQCRHKMHSYWIDKIPFFLILVVENEVWNIDWSILFGTNLCFTICFWLCMMLFFCFDGTWLILGFELLIFNAWLFPAALCSILFTTLFGFLNLLVWLICLLFNCCFRILDTVLWSLTTSFFISLLLGTWLVFAGLLTVWCCLTFPWFLFLLWLTNLSVELGQLHS